MSWCVFKGEKRLACYRDEIDAKVAAELLGGKLEVRHASVKSRKGLRDIKRELHRARQRKARKARRASR